jgi:CheY-like chemotaxis protein
MNYKILVIDDVPKNIEVFKRILEPQGFVVHSATKGHDGVALLKRSIGGYALAIVDYLMPDLNGAETTKLLLEVSRASMLSPVLAMTHKKRLIKTSRRGVFTTFNGEWTPSAF